MKCAECDRRVYGYGSLEERVSLDEPYFVHLGRFQAKKVELSSHSGDIVWQVRVLLPTFEVKVG